jgi:hypothetical protein
LLLLEEFELLLLEEFELLLLEEFELLLFEEFELLLLDELELLLLDELDELLPATTIGLSAGWPAASASMSRPRSGRDEYDQPPSLVGISLATAEAPVSSAASAPSDTNILRFMATTPQRPNHSFGLVGRVESEQACKGDLMEHQLRFILTQFRIR